VAMTSVLDDQFASRVPAEPRLVFTRAPGAHRVLDGGWWPRTRILSEELPGLLAVVESRFGVVIGRISLSATAWVATPERIIVGDRVVQVAWFRACDAHTIRLIGGEFWHLDLLVIEPDATVDAASAALRLVANAHTIGALHTILAAHFDTEPGSGPVKAAPGITEGGRF
jgi:hypothetical protein